MIKVSSIALSALLAVSPALAQQNNYGTIAELTMAAQQASNGGLGMVHGGYLGGGLSGTAQQPAAPAAVPMVQMTPTQPVPLVPAATPIGQPVMVDDNGISLTTTIIAAAIGTAALVIPLGLTLFNDE